MSIVQVTLNHAEIVFWALGRPTNRLLGVKLDEDAAKKLSEDGWEVTTYTNGEATLFIRVPDDVQLTNEQIDYLKINGIGDVAVTVEAHNRRVVAGLKRVDALLKEIVVTTGEFSEKSDQFYGYVGKYSVTGIGENIWVTEGPLVENDTEESGLEEELRALLNRYSCENVSGTPDFVLAEYLIGVLFHYNKAIEQRAAFRGESVEFKP